MRRRGRSVHTQERMRIVPPRLAAIGVRGLCELKERSLHRFPDAFDAVSVLLAATAEIRRTSREDVTLRWRAGRRSSECSRWALGSRKQRRGMEKEQE